MLTIGAHLSIAKGFAHAAETALAMGANTFQFFSRNPRGSSIKAFNAKDIERFQEIREKNAFGPIMAHAPYTLNLASARPDVYTFSRDVIRQDILRMDSLGIEYFNFHPGSPGNMGFEAGLKQIVDGLNEAITEQQNITVLLETMSGRSNEIGGKFEHLHAILTGVNETAAAKMGICLDLCHVFSAGYDIACHLDGVLTEFHRIIGLERLKAIHLNDSMMEFGAGKDRHALIGQGHIGMDAILNFLRHPLTRDLPYYLETPLDDDGHKEEIAMIKGLLK